MFEHQFLKSHKKVDSIFIISNFLAFCIVKKSFSICLKTSEM